MNLVETPRALGLIIRANRRARHWSQSELARAADVSRFWVSQMELGKPSSQIDLVLRALEALDLRLWVDSRDDGSDADDAEADLGVSLDEILGRLREEPQ